MPALIIGANLPDVDAACFFWLEGTEHLGFRRGITHGPPAWILLPLVLAGILWWYDRWQTKRGKRPEGRAQVSFKWLYILSFIGCLSHPALDWLNVYGIRLLEPFSSQWFYGDTLFIIDVWLWALLAVTTWWSLRMEKRGKNWQKPAWIGSVIGLLYIAFNGTLSWHSASHFSHSHGEAETIIASPVPINFLGREMIVGQSGLYAIDGQVVGECAIPDLTAERATNSQLDAFLFWSRALFAERAEDGSIILRDARFYDPRARDRFSLALPDVECVELRDD